MITEKDILKALGDGKVGLPPLAISLIARKSKLRSAGGPNCGDAVLEMSWKGRRWRFLVEIKATATPQAFDQAVHSVEIAARDVRLSPMIILPYLSAANLGRLEEAGVSGLDLCGNGIVTVPGKVLVIRTGEPNRFPRSEPIRNIYRGGSSIAARVFLVRPIYRAVGEIVATIREKGGGVSFATVSKVLKTLQADLIIAKSRNEIRLLQADMLLDELMENYRPPKIAARWIGKVAIDSRELERAIADAARRIDSRFLITGAASAGRYSVLAREPVVAAYCTVAPNDLLSALGPKFEETDRFPNIDLTCTAEELPYFESIEQDGVDYASPVQAYLELMSSDKRQQETAAQVREYILRRVREYREAP